MRGDTHDSVRGSVRRTLSRGELVRLAYRLGRHGASGVLTIAASGASAGRGDVFVLRRGAIVHGDGELARRMLVAKLVRFAAADELRISFEGGGALSPPGAQPLLPLATWARTHLEAQLDNTLADKLLRQLAGIRLSVRADLAPDPGDEADKRMLAAMAQPRRLDQIWPLARTPRFRLLAFLHFLRSVDALEVEGVVAEQSAPIRDAKRIAAARLLGISADDPESVKRAYRRLARALHPDLQPHLDLVARRALERRFAELTAAYETLR